MERLASEYDPQTGQFTFTVGDELAAEISPEQYVEFISQSMMLVQYVVENYFNGSMKKFVKSNKASSSLPANSAAMAEEMDKWLRHKSTKMDFGA